MYHKFLIKSSHVMNDHSPKIDFCRYVPKLFFLIDEITNKNKRNTIETEVN